MSVLMPLPCSARASALHCFSDCFSIDVDESVRRNPDPEIHQLSFFPDFLLLSSTS
jgi:hypothetical protein